jgi:maltooligosyltrehalose trehalohydrolase
MRDLARRYPVGTEFVDGRPHARVWAPLCRRLSAVLEFPGPSLTVALQPEPAGYFSGFLHEASPGTRYRFQLDSEDRLLPDPASRFQPEGPSGPSQLVDASVFPWTDQGFPGLRRKGQVLYELHVGTFSAEGTWAAACRRLPLLAELGISAVQLMPLADSPGRFGWGYDGVSLFAPSRWHGTPEDFRAFVDQAHGLGMGVMLDVVYNHLGPTGSCLPAYSEHYLSSRYETEWGRAFNFDGAHSGPVREYFAANAAYWIEEFHLDGLRFDATQSMFDSSDEHILAALARAARAAGGTRDVLLVGENEPQDARLVRSPSEGGFGLDAVWNDDFHHSATVALTAHAGAYLTDYRGTPQELISAVKRGYLFQGQHYRWQGKPRGSWCPDTPPEAFIVYLQNHDQTANSPSGRRCGAQSSDGKLRAVTAVTLLSPCTPLLLQGQEFAATTPFLYFADHDEQLADSVRRGRAAHVGQFPWNALPESQQRLDDPRDPQTFQRSKLDWSERDRNRRWVLFHQDLLRLRRTDGALAAQAAVDGAVLGTAAFVLRWFSPQHGDRLLLVNLGPDLLLPVLPEPLLAPLPGRPWQMAWSTEEHRYCGIGYPHPQSAEGWYLLGESAALLQPSPEPGHD